MSQSSQRGIFSSGEMFSMVFEWSTGRGKVLMAVYGGFARYPKLKGYEVGMRVEELQ